MVEVGFKVERKQMVPGPEYKGSEDLARLVQLMPYDLFVATRDSSGEVANAIADYDSKMATLYDWVANDSLAHKHCMGYNLKKAIGDVKGKSCLEAACGN